MQNIPWLMIWNTYLLPVAILAGSLVIGLVIDRVVIRWLGRIAARTTWEGDDVVIGAIRGLPVVLCLIAGVHSAMGYVPLKPSIVQLAEKGLTILFVLSWTFVVARVAEGMVELYTPKVQGIGSSTSILRNLAKAAVWVLGALISLQSVGISIAPLLTALGVGGLATALALQPMLTNLFSGIQLLAARKILPGDYVRLGSGEEGRVVDISWRNTAILSTAGNLILVPNATVAAAILTNYHAPTTDMALLVPASCGYGSDLGKVEQLALEVAATVMKEVPGGVPDFQPAFRLTAWGDSAIEFSTVLRVANFTDQPLIRHEFLKRLYDRFNEAGIDIPFPTRTVHIASDATPSK